MPFLRALKSFSVPEWRAPRVNEPFPPPPFSFLASKLLRNNHLPYQDRERNPTHYCMDLSKCVQNISMIVITSRRKSVLRNITQLLFRFPYPPTALLEIWASALVPLTHHQILRLLANCSLSDPSCSTPFLLPGLRDRTMLAIFH